jgi:hypothetical protein
LTSKLLLVELFEASQFIAEVSGAFLGLLLAALL